MSKKEYIWLNVGGERMCTCKSTLERSPVLNAKLERWSKDDSDEIMIDDDPVIFRHVLNVLRYKAEYVPVECYKTVNSALDFYCVDYKLIKRNKVLTRNCSGRDMVHFKGTEIKLISLIIVSDMYLNEIRLNSYKITKRLLCAFFNINQRDKGWEYTLKERFFSMIEDECDERHFQIHTDRDASYFEYSIVFIENN